MKNFARLISPAYAEPIGVSGSVSSIVTVRLKSTLLSLPGASTPTATVLSSSNVKVASSRSTTMVVDSDGENSPSETLKSGSKRDFATG